MFFFELVHGLVKEGYAFIERAQERIFFFLYYSADEFALSCKFGISLAHFVNQNVEQFVDESLFLTEESIGISNGTSQDSANHIAGFSVAGQLSVGY